MKLSAVYILAALSQCGHAGLVKGSQCTSLLHLYPETGPVHVHIAKAIPAGGLNISSEDGSQAQNNIPICHVQGTLTYANGENGHVQADPNGHATLTWEVFLPEQSEYNGRYLGIGMFLIDLLPWRYVNRCRKRRLRRSYR